MISNETVTLEKVLSEYEEYKIYNDGSSLHPLCFVHGRQICRNR